MKHDNQQAMLSNAIILAARMHNGQFDKAGKPYILHCLHVMNTVKSKDPKVLQVAVMHDLMEDCNITAQDLRNMGFERSVVEALQHLTHPPHMDYDRYIGNVCENRIAMLVKLADLRHNSDITRLKGVTEKDFQRIAKYHHAYITIKNKLRSLPQ